MNENGDQNAHSQQQGKLTLLPIVLTDRKEIGRMLDSIEVSDISSKSSEIVLADLQDRRFTSLGVAVLKRVAESVTLNPCILIKRSYKKHYEKREIVEERCLLWTKEDEYRVVSDGKERYKVVSNCDRGKYKDVWNDDAFLSLLANKNGEVAATCKEARLKCETCGGTGVLVTTHHRDQSEIAAGTERHREKCPYCEGRGLTGIHKCKRCDGNGYVTYVTKPKEEYSKSSKCYKCNGTGKESGATILRASRKVEDCVESHLSLIFTSEELGESGPSCKMFDSGDVMNDELRESCEKVWLPSKVPFVKDFEQTLLKVSYKRKEECENFLAEIEKLPLKESGVKRKIADEYKEIIRLINQGYGNPSERVHCEDIEFEVKYVLAKPRSLYTHCDRAIAVKIDDKKFPDDHGTHLKNALMLEDRGGKGFWADICYSGIEKDWHSWNEVRRLPIFQEFRNCWKGKEVSHYSGNRRLKDYRENIQTIIQNAQKECGGVGVKISEPATLKKDETAPKKSEKKAERKTVSTSSKKRWKFILLGLLFGWFGAHYMYAKRWLMLLLTLGSFTTGVVMMNKSESNQKEEPAQTAQQADGNASKSNGDAIGALCLVLWLVMWLGGALFVKKDGKGNRM